MQATTLSTALTAERTGTRAMTNIAPPAPANSLQDRFDSYIKCVIIISTQASKGKQNGILRCTRNRSE